MGFGRANPDRSIWCPTVERETLYPGREHFWVDVPDFVLNEMSAAEFIHGMNQVFDDNGVYWKRGVEKSILRFYGFRDVPLTAEEEAAKAKKKAEDEQAEIEARLAEDAKKLEEEVFGIASDIDELAGRLDFDH